jgi:hypothetical protein
MSIAFLGNSILYFNDCPRLVEQMLQSCYDTVVQDSCLRGGATLPSLFRQGNGMQRTFATPAARQSDGTYDIGASSVEDLLSKSHWDVVVLHDHTQAPARRESREETLTSLEQEYLPLLRKQQQQQEEEEKEEEDDDDKIITSPLIILLQTAAYRYPNIQGSDDLGNFLQFTDKVVRGYQEYAHCLQTRGCTTKIAPVGLAVKELYDTSALFHKLFSLDHFHFSPHGTWLEACVVYCTITNQSPPVFQEQWFDRVRYRVKATDDMGSEDEWALPLPTKDEAEELRQVAMRICNICATIK